MAAFSDLADLFVAAGEYTGRADFAHIFHRFVAIAEDEIERDARFSEQHAYALLTLVNGEANLPNDCLAIRSVATDDAVSRHLNHVSKHLDQTPEGVAPIGYVLDGATIRMVRPGTAEKLRVEYFAKMPRLTSAAPTNWLLGRAGDALMANIVSQIMAWGGEPEKADAARQQYEGRMRQIVRHEHARRYTNAQITPSGGLP